MSTVTIKCIRVVLKFSAVARRDAVTAFCCAVTIWSIWNRAEIDYEINKSRHNSLLDRKEFYSVLWEQVGGNYEATI
jgi:hypothetical protein